VPSYDGTRLARSIVGAKYPADHRRAPTQDNLSAGCTPEIRRWVRADPVTFVAPATRASRINPVECHAGDLQTLALGGSNFDSWVCELCGGPRTGEPVNSRQSRSVAEGRPY
jgi:hypothetical protein